ncbi:tetratricopeptide repeat protein [Archangium primigenium]|uniref:tetratricopeptide repeat protein n=1 Tax=[Archangium] primigenium TaxID=2792470 RepID=UPI00195C7FF1|nr:tetratricopeptide repeat protein [Archangium primigenium]MBM7115225.1 zinc-ribbon domain-containing protein [Archangium primigenium]
MRISCQKCAAAYAIDDRVITPKGVRAQCPRCRHLQLVKREDAPAAAPAPQPAPMPKPAVAAKPAAAARPVPKPAPLARPLTPSASLSDELFGDLGDLAPPADAPDTSASSLLDDLDPSPGAPAVSKDALFGDLADLTGSSPSHQALAADDDDRPNTPGYTLPTGDLLFDDIVQPPPAAPPAPVQAARPAPAPKPAMAPLPEPSDDALFDFNAPPGYSPPAAAPAPTPAMEAFPESSDDALFDFNAPPGYSTPPPVADPEPASASADADPLMDFFGSPPAAPAPGVAAPAPAVMAPPPAATPRGCRECGKPLVDAFDQALGACEDCRQRAQKPVPAPVPENRSVEVIDLPPMDGSSAAAPAQPSGGARAPVPAPALAAEPRSAARAVASRGGVAVSASSGGGKGPLVAAAVVLLLVGGGAAAWFFVPEVRALTGGTSEGGGRAGAGSAGAGASAAVPPAIEAVLPRWQLMFVDGQDGDSAQLITQGQALLAKDQRFAYMQAAEAFQRAVLLDPRSDVAIGGYVQAIALGTGSFMDEGTFKEALLLIEAAEARSQRAPDLLVAHANLLLARPAVEGNLEQARKLAEEVLANGTATAAPKAEANLVLGRTFLGSSRELATQHFESALAIAPDLQRVHYYRALVDETAGDYSLAIGRLQKRLEQDPDHWETRSTLARIYMEVGEVAQARQLFETRLRSVPGELQPQLALAVMRYQVEGGVPAALTSLRGLLRNRDKYDERDVAELLLHLSAVERLSNNMEASAKAGREALQLVKNNPAVRLQLFLVALARKDAAEATTHLAAIKGHLGDASLEKMFEGRLLLLDRKPADAITLFTDAHRLDPRRTDALLLAGIAAAQDGRRDEALRYFSQAIQADPLRLTPRPVVTPFFLRTPELLVGLEGSIAATSRGEDDLLMHLYEGLLRFHLGDGVNAEKMFKKVADVDAAHAPSLALRTLLALGRKDMKSAQAHAARAVEGGRQVAIAHLAQGLVLIEQKQVEPAKRALRDALQLSPRLYSAQVKLDELEASSNPGPVKERLVRLLGLDPSYLPAKRVLYQLEKRG